VVELWGVHDMPEPETTSLPEQNDYQQTPQSDWVYDEDQDGAPAITEQSQGAVSGTMNVVERTVFSVKGFILSADRVQGLVDMKANGSNRLSATNSLLLGQTITRVDPSRVAWFDSARLTAPATCEDVASAVASHSVSTKQPF
jgi:hypothetical protein